MNRDTLRAKQDRLIELVEQHGMCCDLQISTDDAGSPTVRELNAYLFQEWETVIDAQIKWLETQ